LDEAIPDTAGNAGMAAPPGESPVAEICMLKNQATQTMAFCASEAVQIFGGAGFMRGIRVERIYREVKVNAIGGGSEEIMMGSREPADWIVVLRHARAKREARLRAGHPLPSTIATSSSRSSPAW
jgi:Acyl-CoA dehydrogenase, C-terminal domain